MTFQQFTEAVPFEVVCGGVTADICAGYTSDLLSDVMANCPDDSVLVTVQNHTNTIAVATLVGAVAIVLCHNREIPQEMRDAAEAQNVAILRTPLSQFEATCVVAEALRAV
jgi:hypothetical protein